jgi:hypothetical protein
MTKKIDVQRRSRLLRPSSFAALAVPALFALGCANEMTDGKSGETHFLCQSDADCTKHFGNDDYECTGKSASNQTYCAPKTDGGSNLGSGGRGGAASSENGGNQTTGGSKATGGAAGGPSDAGGDFSQCETAPNSTCSVEATCMAVDCSGASLQYDEHGCLRKRCKSDDDCGDGDRCAISQCDSDTICTMQDGMCQCSSLASCGQVPRCNSVATTGPRGDWVNLHVEYGGFCAMPCTSTWDVGPDGHVTGTDHGTPIDLMLDVGQMFDLKSWVDGPSLRVGLRDGLPCTSQQITDVSLNVTLKLSTQTLTKDVTGCFGGDNVFQSVYQLLSNL